MTESEALEVLAIFGEATATYFTMFVSFTFAYLMVAYFLGRSLSRFQCFAVSALYAVSALVTGATTVGWAHAWLILKSRENTMINEVWLFDKPGIFPALIFLLTAIALISLYFMYDVRKKKTDN